MRPELPPLAGLGWCRAVAAGVPAVGGHSMRVKKLPSRAAAGGVSIGAANGGTLAGFKRGEELVL